MKNKKMLKLIGAIVLVVLLAAVFAIGCGPEAPAPTTPTAAPTTPTAAPAQTYEWRLGGPRGEASGHPVYPLGNFFVDRINELSNGRMKITYYPGELLGDTTAQQKAVSAGQLELCIAWASSQMDPGWNLTSPGFAFDGFDSQWKAIGPGGWMVPIYDQIAERSNWKYLTGLAYGSAQGMISNILFDPLDPKGLKCRVQANQNMFIRLETWGKSGFSPVTMPASEAASALTTGAVDVIEGAALAEIKVYGDVFKYYYMNVDGLGSSQFIANLDLFNSLSPADQDIVMQAAAETGQQGQDMAKPTVRKNLYEDLQDWQVLVPLTGDQWSFLAERARETEWPYLESISSKELMDQLRAQAPPLPWGKTIDEMNWGYGYVTTKWLMERQGAATYEEIKAAGL